MWQKAAESARKRRRGKGSRGDLSRAPVFRKRQQSRGTAKIAKGSLEASRASHAPDDRKESEAASNPGADEPKSEVPCEAAHRADVSTAGLRLRSASAATAGPSPAPDVGGWKCALLGRHIGKPRPGPAPAWLCEPIAAGDYVIRQLIRFSATTRRYYKKQLLEGQLLEATARRYH